MAEAGAQLAVERLDKRPRDAHRHPAPPYLRLAFSVTTRRCSEGSCSIGMGAEARSAPAPGQRARWRSREPNSKPMNIRPSSYIVVVQDCWSIAMAALRPAGFLGVTQGNDMQFGLEARAPEGGSLSHAMTHARHFTLACGQLEPAHSHARSEGGTAGMHVRELLGLPASNGSLARKAKWAVWGEWGWNGDGVVNPQSLASNLPRMNPYAHNGTRPPPPLHPHFPPRTRAREPPLPGLSSPLSRTCDRRCQGPPRHTPAWRSIAAGTFRATP